MGVNNKARRAAKRRKQRSANSGPSSAAATDYRYDAGDADTDEQPADAAQLVDQLKRVLPSLVAAAVRAHWTPADLAEITRRRLSARHVPLVAALVAEETARHPQRTVAPAWQNEQDDMGPAMWPDLADPIGVQQAIEVADLLESLPQIAETIPPPGAAARAAAAGSGAPSAALAKVRALLAKAESTEFPEEAEALSAKAQELIATYALDRYAEVLGAADAVEPNASVRRLWLDPPYVDAKAMLVDAVAGANHCRSVLSAYLGFATLVGQPADIEATELLVTSLQVQADRAMLRHGRMAVRPGESRTRSFRRSFLVAYAARIRERLHRAADEALAASGRSTELVPVLARSEERVREVTEELFPEIKMRRTTISNREGWVAGRAAADLARFDIREQLSRDEAAG